QMAGSGTRSESIRLDPDFHGGDYYGRDTRPDAGLGIARRIAHTTYRTAAELDDRFANLPQAEEDPLDGHGRPRATSYLDHHADQLSRRLHANPYLPLAHSISTHPLGRGRGGLAAALERVTARTLVVAIGSDRLFPVSLSEEIARHVPRADLHIASSPIGHDAFLLAHPGLSGWIAALMAD